MRTVTHFGRAAIRLLVELSGNRATAFAFFAGILPLLFGGALAAAYRLTHWESVFTLAILGGLGCLLLVISGLFLLVVASFRRNSTVYHTRAFWCALVILFLDFPAALLIVSHIRATASRVDIRVRNTSPNSLTNVSVTFRGNTHPFPDVPAGTNRRVVYYPGTGPDSSAVLRARHAGQPIERDADVYVTAHIPIRVDFTF